MVRPRRAPSGAALDGASGRGQTRMRRARSAAPSSVHSGSRVVNGIACEREVAPVKSPTVRKRVRPLPVRPLPVPPRATPPAHAANPPANLKEVVSGSRVKGPRPKPARGTTKLLTIRRLSRAYRRLSPSQRGSSSGLGKYAELVKGDDR